MSMIEVSKLVFDYPGQRALDEVSFTVDEGTVTALVGPNGAGKSTLLRCIAGLEVPLAGSIRVAGVDVLEEPRRAHEKLGFLSDSFGLYGELSVAQCLTWAAEAQGMRGPRVMQRVAQVAEALNLTNKLDAAAGNLSRGQRQRVAIGQAIVHEPQVLLLDEPASGLDPDARSQLAGLFRTLQAQGMTLVVSSHILSELDEYSTHILSLRDGRLAGHASLRAEHADGAPRVLLALHLAGPAPQLAQILVGEEVSHLDPSGTTPSTVWVSEHDLQARAALIARLVQAGVPLCGCAVVRTSVQEGYARTVGRAHHDGELA